MKKLVALYAFLIFAPNFSMADLKLDQLEINSVVARCNFVRSPVEINELIIYWQDKIDGIESNMGIERRTNTKSPHGESRWLTFNSARRCFGALMNKRNLINNGQQRAILALRKQVAALRPYINYSLEQYQIDHDAVNVRRDRDDRD